MQQVDSNDVADGSADENESRIRQLSIRAKISRACVACRASKTRCIPLEGQDSCEACFKRSRPCVLPGPAKPRMKSSQKFSELEKKIESLSNALASRVHDEPIEHHEVADSTLSNISDRHLRQASLSNSPERVSNPIGVRNGASSSQPSRASVGFSPASHGDVVDQGYIDIRTAEVLFNHWNTTMRPLHPILKLPSDTTVSQVRDTKPILFLAILAVASASMLPSFETRFVTELNEQLARQIFIMGNRSMELIQACLLYSQYYIRPAGSQNFADTQYVSAALTMSCDLGLAKKVKFGSKSDSAEVKEAARSLLAGWYAASSNAVLHRQQYLVPTNSDIETYMQILSSDSPADLSDQWLCSLVRLQMILDDVSTILGFTNTSPIQAFDQPSTRYTREMLEQRLKGWKESVPTGIDKRELFVKLKQLVLTDSGFTKCAESFCKLYINHLAIRSYTCKSVESGRLQADGHPDHKSIALTSIHFEALCRSLDSSQAVLSSFLSFEDSFTRLLPNNCFLWTMFAIVSLIKLIPFTEMLAHSQDPVVDVSRDSLPYYFGAMIERLARITQNGYVPQAKAYDAAFRKLRLWYSHKREVCINAHGSCDAVDDGAVYSVFGTGPESQEGEPPSNQPAPKPNGTANGYSWQGSYAEPIDGRRELGSSDVSMQTPDSSNTGGLPGFEATPVMDAVYNPSTYANTNWDDLNFSAEAMKEFDTYMMDDDDSWMRYLI